MELDSRRLVIIMLEEGGRRYDMEASHLLYTYMQVLSNGAASCKHRSMDCADGLGAPWFAVLYQKSVGDEP